MLTAPDVGWTEFSIDKENTYHLGYLTDICLEWLDQAIHGLTTLEPFAVHGYCEPDRMICTVAYWNCYIVLEADDTIERNSYREMHGVSLSMIDFCRILYSDISRDIEEWVKWDYSEYRSEAEDRYADQFPDSEDGSQPEPANIEGFESILETVLGERRKLIQSKLDKLKELIDLSEEHFGPHRCFF